MAFALRSSIVLAFCAEPLPIRVPTDCQYWLFCLGNSLPFQDLSCTLKIEWKKKKIIDINLFSRIQFALK